MTTTTSRKRTSPQRRTAAASSTPWLHCEGLVNGVRLHWVQADGRSEKPPVILLHGFPEFWYSWHHQLVALAQAGYLAVAPDLRGYNLSEKPTHGYDLETLSQDVYEMARTIIQQHQPENDKEIAFCLVGHGWGSRIAAAAAARYPLCVRKLVLYDTPQLASTLFQRLWWYFVQVPWIPEFVLGWNHSWLLGQCCGWSSESLSSASDEKTAPLLVTSDTAESRQKIFRDAWSQPGAVRCMLAYFREKQSPGLEQQPIRCPVLLLGAAAAANSMEFAKPPRRVALQGHGMHQLAPEEFNRHLLDFLSDDNPKSNSEQVLS